MARVCARGNVCDEEVISGGLTPPPMPHDPICSDDLTGDELCQTWDAGSQFTQYAPIVNAKDGSTSGGGASYSWHQDVFFDYVEITKKKI